MAAHNELGHIGEQLAIEYLLKKEYKILERNYRYKKAEVDILAQKEDELIVIEVKTRTSNYFGNPEEFVNYKKIKLLTEAVDNYINEKDFCLLYTSPSPRDA